MNKQFFAFQLVERQKFKGTALLGASLVCAVIAQATLIQAINKPEFWSIENWLPDFWKNNSPLPGLCLYAISAWIFIMGLRLLGHIPTQLSFYTVEFQPARPRFGFWITCLGLAAVTAFYSASPSANLYGPALAMVWLLNIALLTFSVIVETRWQPPSFEKVTQWLQTHFLELLGITLIVIIAFMIRFWDIELHPYSFMNDEGEMGNNGICIIQGTCKNIFDIGWAGQPMLSFVPTGISISILGRTATALRLVSAIIGTLSVLAVYIFTREVFGQKEAWVAMALLATLPVNVHFSRLGVDNIIDALSTTAVLGLLFLGIKRGSTLSFLAAGILGGLSMYTYPGSRLAPLLGFGAIGYVALRTRGFLKVHVQNIVIFIFALIITAAPIAGYFLANPNLFFARMESEGIFQNHIFENAIQSGISAVSYLTGQFMKSFLVFFLTSAPSNFFNSPRPYLTPLAAIFFFLGFAYMCWRIKEERFLVLFVWFWTEIILGSTLTGGPPTSQRMLMSTPALTIIIAIGVSRIVENIAQYGKFTRWLQVLGLLIFVTWVGYRDISFYHYEYRVGHYFEDPANELTFETAVIISPLHNNGRLYLLTEPGVPYLSFANFDYFSPDVEKAYLDEVTSQSLANLQKDKDALFIATPDRLNDLKLLATLLPGGEWSEVKRRYQPANMLYYSYKIKQSDLQAYKP